MRPIFWAFLIFAMAAIFSGCAMPIKARDCQKISLDGIETKESKCIYDPWEKWY